MQDSAGQCTTAAVSPAVDMEPCRCALHQENNIYRRECRDARVVLLRTSTQRQMSGLLPRKTTRSS
jgi:hypothetical protein